MREHLAPYDTYRFWWRATYERSETFPSGKHFYLLKNLTHQQREVADHLWLEEDAAMRRRPPRPGQRVGFSARVFAYRRRNGTWDYGLYEVRQWRTGREIR